MTVTQRVQHVMLYASLDKIQPTLPMCLCHTTSTSIAKRKAKIFERSELSFSIWITITQSEILCELV